MTRRFILIRQTTQRLCSLLSFGIGLPSSMGSAGASITEWPLIVQESCQICSSPAVMTTVMTAGYALQPWLAMTGGFETGWDICHSNNGLIRGRLPPGHPQFCNTKSPPQLESCPRIRLTSLIELLQNDSWNSSLRLICTA